MESEERKKYRPSAGVQISPVQQMIASCSGAILTSLFVTPLDVVKIRLQAQSKPQAFTKGNCFLYCNGLMDHLCACINGSSPEASTPPSQWYKKPGKFYGTWDAFIKIARNEGIASLWSGLPPTLVMAVPATVVYFTCYEQLKAKLNYKEGLDGERWKPMVAGATARVWAASVISPLEMVRTKMQSEQLTYREVTTAIRQAVAQGGLFSMWRGLGPTLLRDVPFSALYWFSYESMKSYVITTFGRSELSFSEAFTCGALAGTVAGVLTLPFDVIKTHRQIELGRLEMHHKKKMSSTWRLIQHLYQEQGVKGLFRGLIPRIIKVAPACAIMISTYEYFKLFFYTLNESKNSSERVPRRIGE